MSVQRSSSTSFPRRRRRLIRPAIIGRAQQNNNPVAAQPRVGVKPANIARAIIDQKHVAHRIDNRFRPQIIGIDTPATAREIRDHFDLNRDIDARRISPKLLKNSTVDGNLRILCLPALDKDRSTGVLTVPASSHIAIQDDRHWQRRRRAHRGTARIIVAIRRNSGSVILWICHSSQ